MTQWLAKNKSAAIIALVVLVVAYGFWAMSPDKATSMLRFAWTLSIPLVLGALTGVIGERSGIVNIGIEGQMLAAAFTGFFVAANTGNLWLGVLSGLLVGAVMGAFLAWIAVVFQVDQIILGVVMNIVATGVTSFYYVQGKVLPSAMPTFSIPLLSDLPLVGVFFQGGPIALLTLFTVLGTWYALFRTRWGLRTRAIGEYPTAADTAGIGVNKMRIINTTIAGLLAGAAGVFMSMEQTSSFARDMSAGKGFLALAIMIFGAWFPGRALAAALFFGLASAVASQLQADKVVDIPQQFVNLLPYVLTLLVLALAAGRVRAPASEGIPFVKGEGS
ncbi:MAG: ABC transporter permease [Propionibacteriales bacterium]|nr:ABC transporter permease [Propionibacteriales bacterium]